MTSDGSSIKIQSAGRRTANRIERVASVAGYISTAGISVTRRRQFACSGRSVVLAAALLALLFLVPPVRLVHYIYFDRSGLPDLEPFIRFEIPTIGEI
jgi:hypothetical protein